MPLYLLTLQNSGEMLRNAHNVLVYIEGLVVRAITMLVGV